jgi:hypothetical protein
VVLCSAFAIDSVDGTLTASNYTPHVAIDEHIDERGQYVSAFDVEYKRAGSAATFWEDGVPSGRFGNDDIPTNLSFTPDVCWRETNARGITPFLGGFSTYVPAAGIRGQQLSNFLEYTQQYSDEHFFGAWIASDGDSNADAFGQGGDPSFSRQHVQTASRITFCDNHEQIRNHPTCIANPAQCANCVIPLVGTGTRHPSPPDYILPFDDRGPGLCYFGLPNTWGDSPSEFHVLIRGHGFSEFTLEARYDGPLFSKWDVSSMEFYFADAAISVRVPINSTVAPGDTITLDKVFTAPVGIRQTVMVRLCVNTDEEIEMYPTGPFSPWTVRHFVIPKFKPRPPALRPLHLESTPSTPISTVRSGFPFTLRASDLAGTVEDPLGHHPFSLLSFDFSVAESFALSLGDADSFLAARVEVDSDAIVAKTSGIPLNSFVSFTPREAHRLYVVRITVTLSSDFSPIAPRKDDGSIDFMRAEGSSSYSYDYYIKTLPCSQCPDDAFILGDCSSSADTTCTESFANVCPLVGTFISSSSRRISDLVCSPCSLCTSGAYPVPGSCAGRSDTKCVACSSAPTGQYRLSGCDGFADSVFAPCPTFLVFENDDTFVSLPSGCPLVLGADTIAVGLGRIGYNLTQIRAAAAAASAVNVTGAALEESLRAAGYDIAALQLSTSAAAEVAIAAAHAAAAALSFSNTSLLALVDALRAAGELARESDAVISLNISTLRLDFETVTAAAAGSAARATDAATAASYQNFSALRSQIEAATDADAIFALLAIGGYNLTLIGAHATTAAEAARAATSLALAASNVSSASLLAALSSAGFDLPTMIRDTSAASVAAAAAARAASNVSGVTLADALEASGFNLSNIATLSSISRSTSEKATLAAAAAAAASAAASNGSMIALALAAAGFDLRFADAAAAAAAASAAATSAADAVNAAAASTANVSAPALLLTLASAGFNLTALFNALPFGATPHSFSICSTCASDEFLTRNCSHTSDALCAPCAACSASEFESSPCSPFAPRVCTPCASATDCPAGTFFLPCSVKSQGLCKSWTPVCPTNTFRAAAPTLTSDLICAPCDCGAGAAACDPLSGACLCASTFTGARCDACIEGWFGERCDARCACDAVGASTQACSREDGVCACKPRFAGFHCDRCNATSSGGERFGSACDGACACASTGTCVSGREGSGACACDSEWTGPSCSTPISIVPGAVAPCPFDAGGRLCGDGGLCNALTGACVCAAGFAGEVCSTPAAVAVAPSAAVDSTVLGMNGFAGGFAAASALIAISLSVAGVWRFWRRRNAAILASPLTSPSQAVSSELRANESARDPSVFNRLFSFARGSLRNLRPAAGRGAQSPSSVQVETLGARLLSMPTLPPFLLPPLCTQRNDDLQRLESARAFASPRDVAVDEEGTDSARERFAAAARRRRSTDALVVNENIYVDLTSGRRVGSPTSTVRMRTPHGTPRK